MEIHLDRNLANKRLFPAFDLNSSGTRKEELLLGKDILPRIWLLRKVLDKMDSVSAMEFLREKIMETATNEEFLRGMNQ